MIIQIDLSSIGRPEFILPQLLCHPQIPSPLSGINPRTILGDEWWDEVRRKAYAKNNHCCFACGISAGADKYSGALEAHEVYSFDKIKGVAIFEDVVALCHCCHGYIHSGRLYSRYLLGRENREKLEYILKRGGKILRDVSLEPSRGTRVVELVMLERKELAEARRQAIKELFARNHSEGIAAMVMPMEWTLIIGNDKYRIAGGTYEKLDPSDDRYSDLV